MISIIAAVAKNGAIGQNNQLLWHISNDLKRFKALTSGRTIIMGSRTYDSLPLKPLPKRRNIVISRNESLKLNGCEVFHSLSEALQQVTNEECFVIGGAAIYKQTISIADRLYITWVYKEFEADTFFPKIDESLWDIIEQSEIFHDEASGLNYAFFTYEKKR